MDGTASNVISATNMTDHGVRLRAVVVGLVLGILLVAPSSANAQFGWPSSWNPWSQKEAQPQATPSDPFAERRGAAGSPQYRTAAAPAPRTMAQPNYYQTVPPPHVARTTVSDDSMPAVAPNPYRTPPTANYPSTGATAPAMSYPTTTPYSNSSYAPPTASPSPTMPAAPMMPGGYGAQPGVPQVANLNRPAAEADKEDLFKPARIVAIVNGEPILAGDVLGPINQMIQERMESLTEEQRASVRPEELEQFKEQALKQSLPGLIDVKIVYLEFLRNVPADRRPEMEEMLAKNYYEYQMETDLKEAGVNTRAELDMQLRKIGSSLDKKKQRFVEQMVAYQQIQRNIKSDEEVTHLQMLDYYNEHSQDYHKPARAKWEQLMVKYSEFPNRQAAWDAMAAMGNQVLRGAPLDAVAKRSSQGVKASSGGQYDWTSKGSLKNETIDQAIFSLPVGELSPILESEEGYHIVRVTEREEEGMVPFTKAQIEIKEQIKKDRKKEQMEAYIKGIKEKAQVWTIFDNQAAAEPPK